MPTKWTRLNRLRISKGQRITLLALGRGIGEDGQLSPYGKQRVNQTLAIAAYLRTIGANVRIVWTGGRSRALAKAGVTIGGSGSEGAAMMAYATEQGSTFSSQVENSSTTTVENMTNSASLVIGDVIVVTDDLHYRFGRTQFIAWLVFPHRHARFVAIPSDTYGAKQLLQQLVSTIITSVGMIGVIRGDTTSIQARQNWLQKVTGH